MNYCALDDAFQAIGGAPSPGCSMDAASKAARKEERRKARRCKGPAATYLDLDPDRQSAQNETVPAMNSAIGMTEHVPVTAQYGITEPFSHKHPKEKQDTPNFDKDPLYDYIQSDIEEHVMKVRTTDSNSSKSSRKSYFGASVEDGDDGFADYIPDEKDEPTDFRKAFDHMGVGRAGSTATLPNASANMYWKPLTRTGAQTAFVEHLPPNAYTSHSSNTSFNRDHGSMSDVMKKIDKLFARLEDMNSSTSPEQATSEIMMFVSSGIFVLFLMDLMVKKGSTMRF
jgi:hypothetical protein